MEHIILGEYQDKYIKTTVVLVSGEKIILNHFNIRNAGFWKEDINISDINSAYKKEKWYKLYRKYCNEQQEEKT